MSKKKMGFRPEYEKPPLRGCQSPKACAGLVRRAASKVRRRANSSWAKRENLVRMLRGDVKDMLRVAKAVAAGRKMRALDITSLMDTQARDEIPLQVYCWLDPGSVFRGCK